MISPKFECCRNKSEFALSIVTYASTYVLISTTGISLTNFEFENVEHSGINEILLNDQL